MPPVAASARVCRLPPVVHHMSPQGAEQASAGIGPAPQHRHRIAQHSPRELRLTDRDLRRSHHVSRAAVRTGAAPLFASPRRAPSPVLEHRRGSGGAGTGGVGARSTRAGSADATFPRHRTIAPDRIASRPTSDEPSPARADWPEAPARPRHPSFSACRRQVSTRHRPLACPDAAAATLPTTLPATLLAPAQTTCLPNRRRRASRWPANSATTPFSAEARRHAETRSSGARCLVTDGSDRNRPGGGGRRSRCSTSLGHSEPARLASNHLTGRGDLSAHGNGPAGRHTGRPAHDHPALPCDPTGPVSPPARRREPPRRQRTPSTRRRPGHRPRRHERQGGCGAGSGRGWPRALLRAP